ncbi:hypothetical protein [Paenibacillus sp. GCM10027626]|uniref:hypothetical protein n=1 Tax=Paenibacillus sp. GCM10027626 TaxID=3273411 RepID=UPI00362C8C13
MQQLIEDFKNPPAAYRGKPFWAWNGKLEKEELIRQIHIMKEMGFGGFFMHSRVGLETEYLGDEWFDLINACTDEGTKLGMEAWLYDEDRWPSGTAGGLVTENPAHRMKKLALKMMDGSDFRWHDDWIAAFAASVDGITLHKYRSIDETTPKAQYENETVLAFRIEEMAASSFYNGYTYLDTLSGAATEAFIQITHERYKERCGNRLGTKIAGVFTDEPHRGRLMASFTSGGENEPGLEYTVPWTPLLFGEFEKAFGYDVRQRLPELFLQYKGSPVSQVKWQYVELLQRLFLQHFIVPLHDWCKANDMVLTGHGLQENSLAAQTAMTGSMMRLYEHMGYPGVDVLSEFNRSFWIVKQLSSVARQTGRKWLLSELYGCTGWQMPFAGHKQVGDWQALLGINLRCHHLSWYTMQGEAKRDYPASIFHQSAWWDEYKFVEDYFSRIGLVMSQGASVCETLVIHPVESVWCQVYPGWCDGLAAQDEAVKRLELQFMQLFHWLSGARIDFDYGDEEMMGRMCQVEPTGEGPVLRFGEAIYRQVVVAGMTTIRSSTLALLEQFLHAGGRVIFAGEPPEYMDGVLSGRAAALSRYGISVPFVEADLATVCNEGIRPIVEVTGADGSRMEDIYAQVRRTDDTYIVMLLNVNREQGWEDVHITLHTPGYVEQWDCAKAQRYAASSRRKDVHAFIRDIPAGGELIFVTSADCDESLKPYERKSAPEACEIEGPFDYVLNEPNICVLDLASCRVDGGVWQDEEDILHIDRKLRVRYGLETRGGTMIQPWFEKREPFEVKGEVELKFMFDVAELPDSGLELALEKPDHFEVFLNGTKLQYQIERHDCWIDQCFSKIRIPHESVVQGTNHVLIRTAFHQGIDLEAIYLLGQFGVSLQGTRKTLTRMPAKLEIGDVTKQGFPFYSGKIKYIVDLSKVNRISGDCSIAVPYFGGACVKVFTKDDCGDAAVQMIAWAPYEAELANELGYSSTLSLEISLTRRNTFGPLHQIPLYARAYGPTNFVTEGEHYTKAYQLVPSGLLAAPRIYEKQVKGG